PRPFFSAPAGSGVLSNFRFFLYSSRPIFLGPVLDYVDPFLRLRAIALALRGDGLVDSEFSAAGVKPIIAGMGRLRIKKKEAVITFRETPAYRMMLLARSVVVFLLALYIMIGALHALMTVFFISSLLVAA